jgi:hypothetical protein
MIESSSLPFIRFNCETILARGRVRGAGVKPRGEDERIIFLRDVGETDMIASIEIVRYVDGFGV